MSKLKVTGLTKIPSSYKGEPCVMTVEITDVIGGRYESEIHMDNGYSEAVLRDAMVASFKMCDATAKSVNVRSFRVKKEANNE
jgi:hypothetical protein